MKSLNMLATALIVVGALNWGLVGLVNFDLVATLLGPMSLFSRIVYSLVGVSAVYYLFSWKSLHGAATTTDA
jgi:uncharacterized membrane protein YuzA (DUF378 family)